MTHLEFAASETAALRPSSFEKWVNRVEELLGFSLDGDQSLDGYSLDLALDAFREGRTPRDHASAVRSDIASLAAN